MFNSLVTRVNPMRMSLRFSSNIASVGKKVVPLFDRVLVQRVKPESKTNGGIYIPQKSQETLNEAVVIATGPGLTHPQTGKLIPMAVKPGDRVLLPNFGGNTVNIGKEEFVLYRDTDFLAKLQ
ncbi:10 kDa heat shock protein, mitochondrial [Piromyces finnis]|uniref:10 kDa heat shock protein, mitochondrial n=1 Tax=Piromyces finnis TaxID=1754191 RepID=A0A1Y1V128_9FUNG|nr:10 kDa heat shock protein, mitochondrial [Piromyces finnis]|eukprot:ORX44718.1 10 kDa heat shock protein, mitochondrial [Piromyces finnis]